jgi:hypothetical protein
MKSLQNAVRTALILAATILLGCNASSGNRPAHPAAGGGASSNPTPSSTPKPVGQSSGAGNTGTAAGAIPPKQPSLISDTNAVNQTNQAGSREAELDKTRTEIMKTTRSIQAAGRKVDFASILKAGNAPAEVKPNEAGFAEYVTTKCDKPELLNAMLAALRTQQ